MADPSPRRSWREFLSAADRRDLDGLEANAKILDDRRLALSREIELIRWRGISKRLYVEKRETSKVTA